MAGDKLPLATKRIIPVEMARRELNGWLIDWQERHDLTEAEWFALLAEEVSTKAHLLVKHERRKP